MNLATRITNLVALVLSAIWFAHSKWEWEPAIAVITLFAAQIFQEVRVGRVSPRRERDKTLARQFLEVLPYEGSISFINHFNMAGFSFDRHRLDDLWKFYEEWKDAQHEFLDRGLEKKRKRLWELCNTYLNVIVGQTFSTKMEWQSVPPEWELEQPERFIKVVSELHSGAQDIVKAHQELVRSCERKFGLLTALKGGSQAVTSDEANGGARPTPPTSAPASPTE